jgi:hypothetical protein
MQDYRNFSFNFDYSIFNYSYFAGQWNHGEGDVGNHLDFKDFRHLEPEIKIVSHKDIAWVGKHHYPKYAGRKCFCCAGERFINADISYPGIIVKDGPNPYGNPYLLLDGKHRMMKKLAQGMDESEHYVLYWKDIREYLTWKEKD